MVKIIDMSGFDPLLDNLEKYVNKQGYTPVSYTHLFWRIV